MSKMSSILEGLNTAREVAEAVMEICKECDKKCKKSDMVDGVCTECAGEQESMTEESGNELCEVCKGKKEAKKGKAKKPTGTEEPLSEEETLSDSELCEACKKKKKK